MTFGHPANSGISIDVNPAKAIAAHARTHGGAVVIRYEGGDLTYAQLNDRAARLGHALAEGGVAPGDRVAYLGLNSPAFLITMLAAFRVGALFVPVNFRLAGPELQTVLERSGTTTIVCEEGHRDSVDLVRGRIPIKRFLLVDDDPATPTGTANPPGWERWSQVLSGATPHTERLTTSGFDDPAILMFTSGTTGLPKGVILTHGNIWWNSVNVDSRIDTRRWDTTYAVAPLFHVGALNSFVVRTMVRGGTILIRRTFEPQQFLDDLIDHQVNSLFAVPSMLAALGRLPGAFTADLSALRSIVVAGAPVPPSLIRQFAEHGIWLQQSWGLTETAPFATHLPVEHTLQKIGSAGTAMPHTEVGVVDLATNQPVPAGVPGEVVVRGPNVTPGYWQDSETTRKAFDRDGWFHSGDIGYLDGDGCLFIVDRLKDMIITGGENVYPAEIERALAGMSGLNDIAVVGTADDEWGETVVAVVSVLPGATVTLEDLRSHGAEKLARYKLPRRLTVVDQVPRNASGKLDKLAVRKMLHEGASE
ncbi:fatty-acid--CoA ligase [Mycolicibacterium sp. (ex Dasyatis americana)]|nr:fatty-acid--CoA ligase [Mycolicibacterium sp. (ex Dasyatis americana)]